MSTLIEQIMTKIGTALATATATKYESLDDALASDAVPALIYTWRTDETEEVGMVDKHTLAVTLHVLTRGASAESGAHTLLAQAFGLMVADRSLGGLVKKMQHGLVRRESAPEGGKGVLFTQHYDLDYMAARGSMTVFA